MGPLKDGRLERWHWALAWEDGHVETGIVETEP